MDPTDPSSTTDPGPATGLSALQWARVLQLFKQHGITGVILLLLFYQLGFFSQAQSYGCGI
jgi:hypothetical protein